MQIEDLYEDLQDGLKLIALLQIITRERVAPKFNKKPRMRIQKLENLNLAFQFLQKKNITVTNIGSSDICDGNSKLVLGLIWTLIKYFQVAAIDVDGVSGKDGLLLWCDRSLNEYPNIHVKNFTTSWNDGMAFCGLIHRFYPNLIDIDSLDPSNAAENVELAFNIAYEKFKIPKLLNVEDIAGNPKPDDKSILTYVSLLFQEFASGMQKKKAATTITKAINVAQRIESLRAEYESAAMDLLAWLKEQVEKYQNPPQPHNLKEIKNSLAALSEYKKSEKPPRDAEYVKLEGCAARWISCCKTNGRDVPTLNPPVNELVELKKALDSYEKNYEMKLREDHEKFQKTELFLEKVVGDLGKLENWAEEKKATILFDDSSKPTSTAEAEEHIESLQFLEDVEISRFKAVLNSVMEDSKSLSEEHPDTVATLERVEAMKTFFDDLLERLEPVKEEAQAALKRQQEIDNVAKESKVLIRNLKYTIEEYDDEIESSSKIPNASKSHIMLVRDNFKSDVYERVNKSISEEQEKLLEKKAELESAGRESEVQQIEKCILRVEILLQTCQEKLDNFEKEIELCEKKDAICQSFAELSESIKEKCNVYSQALNNTEGTLPEQQEAISKLKAEISMSEEEEEDALKEKLEAVEKINEEMEEMHIFSNPFTTETIQGLRALVNSLENSIQQKVESIESELALNKLGNLTQDQQQEIKEVFDHFDMDQDGILARDEFIMACRGLGLPLSDDDCHTYFDKIDVNQNDEISFDEFSEFCAEQLESGSTEEDVLAAFEVLAHDSHISHEKLEINLNDNAVDYIVRNSEKQQQDDEDVYDYVQFTKKIFS